MSRKASTVDRAEVERFSALAEVWWNPRGKMGVLHKFNPVRLGFIKEAACRRFERDTRRLDCLAGLRILDIGCGAGILSEPLARLGAALLGADPAAANIAAAKLHAAESGLAIDYRDYGKSDPGFPTERSVNEDARAAYDYLRARQPALPVVVHGESLGGGPACELALHADVSALILQSAFTSIPAMAAVVYPLLPMRALIRTRFDNLAKVPKIAAPKLIIHSHRDEIVPFAMGEQLFAAAREPKQKLWLSTSGHNDALFIEHAALIGTMRRFLEQLRLTGTGP